MSRANICHVICPMFYNFEQVEGAATPELRELIKRTIILKVTCQGFIWIWSFVLLCLSGGLMDSCVNNLAQIWLLLVPVASILYITVSLLRLMRMTVPKAHLAVRSRWDFVFFVIFLINSLVITLTYYFFWNQIVELAVPATETTVTSALTTSVGMPPAKLAAVHAAAVDADNSSNATSLTTTPTSTSTLLTTTEGNATSPSQPPTTGVPVCSNRNLQFAVKIFSYMLACLYLLCVGFSISRSKVQNPQMTGGSRHEDIDHQTSSILGGPSAPHRSKGPLDSLTMTVGADEQSNQQQLITFFSRDDDDDGLI